MPFSFQILLVKLVVDLLFLNEIYLLNWMGRVGTCYFCLNNLICWKHPLCMYAVKVEVG